MLPIMIIIACTLYVKLKGAVSNQLTVSREMVDILYSTMACTLLLKILVNKITSELSLISKPRLLQHPTIKT